MPKLTPKTTLKIWLRAAFVALLFGWTLAPAPAAAQYTWPIRVSPALQMVLDRVQQRYLAASGATVKQIELQSPRTMATMVGLVIREQRFHAQRNPALQGQLEELVGECLSYLFNIGAAVRYRESWKNETGSWANMQSFFHAAVAGQLDEWAQSTLGVRPETGPEILQHVRIDPNRPPLRAQPAAPQVVGPPPAAQPPGPSSARPLEPMQDEKSITLLGQSAGPPVRGPPTATIAEAKRKANDLGYRAMLALQQKRYPEALANYNAALSLAPEDGHYWAMRSNYYWALKQYDLAFADVSKAIQLDPGNHQHWGRRAQMHLQLRQKQEALRDLDQECRLGGAEKQGACNLAESIRAGRFMRDR